jgi:hypothetical protein
VQRREPEGSRRGLQTTFGFVLLTLGQCAADLLTCSLLKASWSEYRSKETQRFFNEKAEKVEEIRLTKTAIWLSFSSRRKQ